MIGQGAVGPPLHDGHAIAIEGDGLAARAAEGTGIDIPQRCVVAIAGGILCPTRSPVVLTVIGVPVSAVVNRVP